MMADAFALIETASIRANLISIAECFAFLECEAAWQPQRGGAKRGRVKKDSSPLPPNLPAATQLRRFTTKLDELALGYKRKTDGVKVDGIVDVANRISARMDEARDRSEGIPKAETRTERHLRQKYTRSGR